MIKRKIIINNKNLIFKNFNKVIKQNNKKYNTKIKKNKMIYKNKINNSINLSLINNKVSKVKTNNFKSVQKNYDDLNNIKNKLIINKKFEIVNNIVKDIKKFKYLKKYKICNLKIVKKKKFKYSFSIGKIDKENVNKKLCLNNKNNDFELKKANIEINIKKNSNKIKINRLRKIRIFKKMIGILNNINKFNLKINNITFPNYPYENKKSKLLFKYIKKRDFINIKSFIMNNTNLINQYDFLNRRPIHWLSIKNQISSIEFLIIFKPIINIRDIFDKSPLEYSIENENIEMINLFLKNGSDIYFSKNKKIQEITKNQKIVNLMIKYKK